MTTTTHKPLTPGQRVTRSRQRAIQAGAKRVSTLLTDPTAIAELNALIAEHGSQRAALEAALRCAEQFRRWKAGC